MNTLPTLTLEPSWLHFVRVVLMWNQTKDAGWYDDVESVQILASACIICFINVHTKLLSFFVFTANLKSGDTAICLLCAKQKDWLHYSIQTKSRKRLASDT